MYKEECFQNRFGLMKYTNQEFHKGFAIGHQLQESFSDDEATANLTAFTDLLFGSYHLLPESLQDASDGLLEGLMEGLMDG